MLTLATLVVLVAIIPLIYVVYSGFQLETAAWGRLWSSRLVGLLANTLSLAALVAAGCFVLGVSAAWLVARRDFPGRRLAVWLMVLPLAVPTYVLAHIYTVLLTPEGALGQLWRTLLGDTVPIPDLYNLLGVAVVLTLAGFPYVFLLVRAALERSNQTLEEAARIHGARPRAVLLRVTLPLVRPAIAAGLALVVLHVLSDFGAVSMLRFQTFTLSIYLQMSGRFDYQAAAALSLVLVGLSLSFLVVERFFRSRSRYYGGVQPRQIPPQRATGREQLLIWGWLGLIALLAFVLPLGWMLEWSWQAWRGGAISTEFWGYVTNSLLAAFLVATVAMVMALPVGLFHVRRPGWLGASYMHLASVGFVLPGPVVALGLISFLLAQLPVLYGGLAALVLALVIRFLPLAIQSEEAAMQQLTPSIEQAGRVHGAGPLENLWRVTLPLIRGGLASAWVLVFIDALKELPATLILRPIGFDTLPVRIWIEASEEMLEHAAPAALMLVAGSLPALWILMRSEQRALPR